MKIKINRTDLITNKGQININIEGEEITSPLPENLNGLLLTVITKQLIKGDDNENA